MFLCIDIDAFFVSVEQILNPALIGKPVIVGGLPGQRGVVASASYEARNFGIRSGMPTAKAYKLCPKGIFVPPHFNEYEIFSKRFKEIIASYSPDVAMASIDEAYLNIKGTERLFGKPLILAQKLKKEIKSKLDLPTSIGIARTRAFSKIACDQAKPNGLLMIKPEEEINFIAPLKVGVLPGIGPKHLEILNNLNIKTVRELFEAPEWVLNTALGNYHKIIRLFLFGNSTGETHERVKSVSRSTTLNEDTMDMELLSALLYRLIEHSCAALRKKNLTAKTLAVKIRFSDFKTLAKRTRIPTPTNCQQKIYGYGIKILTGLVKEGKKRVRLVGIALSNFEYDGQQPSMFTVKEERLNRLNRALDRAREKLGSDCLFSANAYILKK